MTVLESILEGVRDDLERRKSETPLDGILRRAEANRRRRTFGALRAGGRPRIIAEIKRASPSKGWIRKDLDAAETARRYVAAGADAVSVLTEGRRFGGSLDDLAAASEATGDIPVLRKDFLLDDYMLAESRAFGADLVLLMVCVLRERTDAMVRAASRFGLTPLVEIHDEEELARALASGASVIGINNRDLRTLEVALSTSERLLPRIPTGIVKVVESGISRPEDVRRLRALGADAFLVGEALVTSGDPSETLKGLLKSA